MVVLGLKSIGTDVINTQNIGDALLVAADSAARKILLPVSDMTMMQNIPTDLPSKFTMVFYTGPTNTVFKGFGVD